MSQKIYTKTGDKGTTSLLGGTKVSKADLRIEAYGTVDELNSHLGLCRDLLTDNATGKTLAQIQDCLFIIGSSLAHDGDSLKMDIPQVKDQDIELLEKEIDRMDEVLPELKQFILPGGHPTVSHLHIARCVCRRAERCCVRIGENGNKGTALVIKYLNRLSDYLFVLARYIAHLAHIKEITWSART